MPVKLRKRVTYSNGHFPQLRLPVYLTRSMQAFDEVLIALAYSFRSEGLSALNTFLHLRT